MVMLSSIGDALRVIFICLAAFCLVFTLVLVSYRLRGDYVPQARETSKVPSYIFVVGILILFVASAIEQYDRLGDKTISWRLPVFGAGIVLVSISLLSFSLYDFKWARKHRVGFLSTFWDRKTKKESAKGE